VQPDPAESPKRTVVGRAFWRAIFCVGAVPPIGCITTTAAHPLFGATPPWIYWAAVGSAVLCAIAAVQLRNYERYDAADEGAWLARVGTGSSKSVWHDLDGTDD
jgi:hypothetical protein